MPLLIVIKRIHFKQSLGGSLPIVLIKEDRKADATQHG
jgi:hypothetical protein